jgi:hypothetical protein
MRDHRIEPQPLRILRGDRRANDAGRVPYNKRHFLRSAERGCDDQITLPLTVLIVSDDDDFAIGKSLEDFRYPMGHGLRVPV